MTIRILIAGAAVLAMAAPAYAQSGASSRTNAAGQSSAGD